MKWWLIYVLGMVLSYIIIAFSGVKVSKRALALGVLGGWLCVAVFVWRLHVERKNWKFNEWLIEEEEKALKKDVHRVYLKTNEWVNFSSDSELIKQFIDDFWIVIIQDPAIYKRAHLPVHKRGFPGVGLCLKYFNPHNKKERCKLCPVSIYMEAPCFSNSNIISSFLNNRKRMRDEAMKNSAIHIGRTLESIYNNMLSLGN